MTNMPFRLNEFRAKIQFISSAEMPSLIHKAAVRRKMPSNTVYIQHAVCEALARDLDMPLDRLLGVLPPPKARVKMPFGDTTHPRTGSADTIEEVR